MTDRLRGRIIFPNDAHYSTARQVWNHAVNKYPQLIVQCSDANDVARAIDFARQHDLLTAVRGGCHSFAGYGVCDDGMVIDLSPMKQAMIDPANRRIRIEAGIVGQELDCMTQAFKLAVPLGSCPSTGVVGYALGGGVGSLTPKFGYGCDNVTELEVITADCRKLTVSATRHDDLFWAMCGAGANFGVVTSLDLQLHPLEQVLSGHLKYPIRQAAEVLTFIKQYASGIPDELFLLLAVLPHPGERMLNVSVVWPGDADEGAKAITPLRQFLKPQEDTIEVRAYLDEQRAGSDNPGDGAYSTFRRGGHLEHLTSESIEVIAEHASNAPTESSGITMIYWHSPWCSKDRDANAFGFRRTGYHYWIHSYWQRPEDGPKGQQWVSNFFTALAPYSSGAVYVNDLQDEGPDRVRAAYGHHYERLTRIKERYDKENFFKVNQNILPTST